MTAKKACGGCGSTGGCGCGTPNPYERTTQAVWHDPTTYQVGSHGPSFLPKLAHTERRQVQAFVRRQAAYMHPGFEGAPLSMIVQYLRALSFVHQTHHWQTFGPQFYADHQLFDRLYKESLEFIDQLAERAVATEGLMSLDSFLQAGGVVTVIAFIGGHVEGDSQASSLEAVTPDLMVQRSLRGEAGLLKLLATLIPAMQAKGTLTPGTSNLLEGVADKHESFVYLLQQRSSAQTYSYER